MATVGFRSSQDKIRSTTPLRQYRPLVIASLVIPLTGTLLLILHSLQYQDPLAVSMFSLLVALSATLVGGLLGFIFGIPRALQGGANNDGQDQLSYGVNTNLEQISDWLTKILVGVGLVELGAIAQGLGTLAQTLSPSLGGPPSGALVAGAEIASFTTWGFLFVYLLTRTYLTAAFKDFDSILPGDVTNILEELTASLSTSEAEQTLEDTTRRASYGEDVGPSENREPVGVALPRPIREVTSLVTLRAQAVKLLAQLIAPARTESPSESIEILKKRGVLDFESAEKLEELLLLADMAVGGATLPVTAEPVVKRLGAAVLDQLALRGRTAAALFEQHVLTFLQKSAPIGWKVQTDIPVVRKSDGSIYLGYAGHEDQVVARADAAVLVNGAKVIVEVRSRANDGTRRQLDALRRFLDRLPTDAPVVLVLPTTGSTSLRELVNRRTQQITVIAWDDERDSLLPSIGIAASLASGSRAGTGSR